MSKAACATIKVSFETRVFGRIVSEKGDVPIKDVTVKWTVLDKATLIDTNIRGVTTTNEKGDFILHIMSSLVSENTALVRVMYEKKSGQHFHTFRCGDEACIHQDVLFEHMTFANQIKVFDTSTLPFSGRVSFANVAPKAISSLSPGTLNWPMYNSQNSCPLARSKSALTTMLGAGKWDAR